MYVNVAVLKETAPHERRVALVPSVTAGLVKLGAKLQMETGMMFINNIDWTDAELPFGGIKDSGYGRELGNMGIQEFVNKKLVRTHDMVAPLV